MTVDVMLMLDGLTPAPPTSPICSPTSTTCSPIQVILKPDPGNAQDLYLASLRALGVDTQQHDVRPAVRRHGSWRSLILAQSHVHG